MFKALGNPHRFEIVKFLVTHPGCITGDIVEFLPTAQDTVSQHLRALREAGWISGFTQGPATSYCLNAEAIAWFRTKARDVFQPRAGICSPSGILHRTHTIMKGEWCHV